MKLFQLFSNPAWSPADMIQGKKITGAPSKGQQNVVASLTSMSSVASGSKSIDMKEKKEKQDVVIAALSVLSNATNKHLLQQQDTQNAARALAVNLEVGYLQVGLCPFHLYSLRDRVSISFHIANLFR